MTQRLSRAAAEQAAQPPTPAFPAIPTSDVLGRLAALQTLPTPELNPVERVWLHLRERFLSHRVLDGYDAIVEACCEAWNALTPERIRSLTAFPWITRVTS